MGLKSAARFYDWIAAVVLLLGSLAIITGLWMYSLASEVISYNSSTITPHTTLPKNVTVSLGQAPPYLPPYVILWGIAIVISGGILIGLSVGIFARHRRLARNSDLSDN